MCVLSLKQLNLNFTAAENLNKDSYIYNKKLLGLVFEVETLQFNPILTGLQNDIALILLPFYQIFFMLKNATLQFGS